MPKFTPEQRTKALMYFLGWQGGTIHQVADEIGISAYNIHNLDMDGPRDNATSGWFGVRTCGMDWRREVLLPKAKGDWSFWTGVIEGFWATGDLSETRPHNSNA